jgi:hypothetical protein
MQASRTAFVYFVRSLVAAALNQEDTAQHTSQIEDGIRVTITGVLNGASDESLSSLAGVIMTN